MNVNRREVLMGGAAIAVAVNIPAAPAVAVPPRTIIPAWAVGTPGEWNYQHIVAKTEEMARRYFAAEWCGAEDCEHGNENPECDCEFCEKFYAVEADRKPMWDGKENITAGDWLRGQSGVYCSRCSYETFPEEGGHAIGDEAVCSDCMTLADWDIVDPKHAAEIRRCP